MTCGVGHRCSSDPMLLLLWLWHRLAATAPIGPLEWDPPYAIGVAIKRKNTKKNLPCVPSSPKIKLLFERLKYVKVLCVIHKYES